MHIDILETNGATIVKPVGSMDATTTAVFVTACQDCLAKKATKILVDLAGVEYMSSAGLRGILTVLKASRGQGVPVAVCGLQPMVAEVFKISGFSAMMPVHDTQEAALAAL
ncbi:MAG: anti-sigma factor antagonist [Deltaproteobacteria bacterium]|nr:anti-sigma factor antagonist [Deltaproteobacteria bacterium]